MLAFGIRPAHVLIVRCAGLTTRPPTYSLKSFGYVFFVFQTMEALAFGIRPPSLRASSTIPHLETL
ncbi:MAG: hypothetical protein JNK42_05060 [Caedimonas sp.]|nr:hypothetical protein [Caedimonas sp.]